MNYSNRMSVVPHGLYITYQTISSC